MNTLCADIIEQVVQPLLNWKETSNLCSCNKYLHNILAKCNSHSNKVVMAKKEIDYMNHGINEIAKAINHTLIVQGIVNLYSRMDNKKDVYLRLPCLTVVALAQLSRIVCENSDISELQLLLHRLQTIYSYTKLVKAIWI